MIVEYKKKQRVKNDFLTRKLRNENIQNLEIEKKKLFYNCKKF